MIKSILINDAMSHISLISLLKLVESSRVQRRQLAVRFSQRSFSFEEEAEKRPDTHHLNMLQKFSVKSNERVVSYCSEYGQSNHNVHSI